jgi:hypothetical protein
LYKGCANSAKFFTEFALTSFQKSINFRIGETFSDYESLKDKILKYSNQENVQYDKRDFRSVAAAKARALKNFFNEDIKFSELTYSYIHGGRTIKSYGDEKPNKQMRYVTLINTHTLMYVHNHVECVFDIVLLNERSTDVPVSSDINSGMQTP